MFENKEVRPDLRSVESELVELAGHLAAATCRFLQLLAEFDTRRGWAGPGLRSCAHWLNWRVGLNLRTARDHLRVAHALTALPAVTAAFAAGRISYSKVRALTRIATPTTEKGLLSIALHGTASHMETVVADARARLDPRPVAARRGMWCSRAADGSLLVRLRLPAGDGAQLLAEVEALCAVQETGTEQDSTEQVGVAQAGASPAGPAEPSGTPAARGPDRSAEHPHNPGGAAEPSASPLSTPRPAEPVAARRLDALLALLAGHRPHHPPTLVVHFRADADADADAPADAAPDADAAATADAAGTRSPDERPVAWIEGGPALHPAVACRLACGATVQALVVDRHDNPLYLGRRHRSASPAQVRALRVRDRGRCVFPGCTATRHLQAHHVRWWRNGGSTDVDNLVLICTFHHTLVHEHGYRLIRDDRGSFTATYPSRTPIPEAGPPTHGDVDGVRRPGIDDRTITPRWGGERLDRDLALAWLLPELRRSATAAA